MPDPAEAKTEGKKKGMERMLEYMGLKVGQKMTDLTIDKAFIGSCVRHSDISCTSHEAKQNNVQTI